MLSLMLVFTMMPQLPFVNGAAWANEGSGTTVINSADDLADLGGKDVTGTIELACDINMNNLSEGKTMSPIKSLTGTFEGNGYTISNLTLTTSVIEGSGYSTKYMIGLIGKLDGEVKNLKLNDIKVELATNQNYTYAGTIVGRVDCANAKITNCSVTGTLMMPSSATTMYTGGIIGGVYGTISNNAGVTVTNCVNNVNVSSGSYPGGIVGATESDYVTLKIENCAVLGNVTKTGTNNNGGGGFIGYCKGTINAEKVYFAGNAAVADKCAGTMYIFSYNGKNVAAKAITIKNIYYEKTDDKNTSIKKYQKETVKNSWDTDYCNVTNDSDDIVAKTAEQLKGQGEDAVSLDGFAIIGNDDTYGGYPVPTWLTTLSDGEHTVNITANGAASVTLTSVKTKATTTLTKGENVFTGSLVPGEYTYVATPTDDTAKGTATGSIVVSRMAGATEKTITLPEPTPKYATTITVTPANANLAVYKGTDATGTEMMGTAGADGTYTYQLEAGSYYYVATAEDYNTESKTFAVAAEGTNTVNIAMSEATRYDINFNVTCGEKTPTVKVSKNGREYAAKAGNNLVYELCNGTYTYEVSTEDYLTKTGTFTVEGSAQTVAVTLSGVSGDGTEANPFQISSKDELKYFAEQVNAGKAKYAKAYVQLASDINLEGESWTPLGKNSTAPFMGHLDGQKHTVSGLNVDSAQSYYGFFGCLKDATVESLTLTGQVYCSEPYARVGGLAGYAIGDVTIKNCGSGVNVSALARGCEGIGGLVGGYEDGIEYKWEDHRMLIENSYNAGNIVCTGTDADTAIGGLVGGNKNCVQLLNCYNVGTVYGPGVQAAGLLGNAGYQTGDNCRPSITNCYNAGQVTGATGKAYGLYAKGTIAESRIVNCYVLTASAAATHNGAKVVESDELKAKAAALGSAWTVDESVETPLNNGLPYIAGTTPVAADNSLNEELNKYKDTITVAGTVAAGGELKALKDTETASEGITAAITVSDNDKNKEYLTVEGGTLKLAKQNAGSTAVEATATLTLTKDGMSISKPISIVIYPATNTLTTLMDNIAKSCENSSDAWAVFDMAAYKQLNGKSSTVDNSGAVTNYINLAINALAQNNALISDRAKGEIVLTTIGVDTKDLTTVDGVKYNNAAQLKAMNMNVGYYTAPWILLADEMGNVQLTEAQIKTLVNVLTANQGVNGLCQGAYWGKTYDDIDTTGIALAALARFKNATEDTYGVKDVATDFINKAVDGLKKAQGDNGSFGNVNTDAMVITGLAAIGQNPTTFNGKSLANALTLYVIGNGFGTTYISNEQAQLKAQALATEQGFRALVVLAKMSELGENSYYNIYTGSAGANAGATTETAKPVKRVATKAATANAAGTPDIVITPSGDGSGSGSTSSATIVATLKVCPDSNTEWLSASYTLTGGATAYDLITEALKANDMSYDGTSSYIKSVTKGGEKLGQFDKGANSGWMYTVNGTAPSVGVGGYTLKNGDVVKLYYTEDYTKDSSSKNWSGGGSGAAVTPETDTKVDVDKAKTDASASITEAASKNKYDDAEAAEIKKIEEKAKADIKEAKTAEEVKAIEEAAKAEIEKVFTSEEKQQVAATEKVDKKVFKTKSKVTKVKGKKAVKISWSVPEGITLDGFEIYRSTKKTSGFGTKPYFTTTKTSYTNNKSLKSGKTYYYKVKGYVIINGEKFYTGYSSKAYRTI